MKRIGLLGGMSWESSAVYYRLVNQLVRERLGGLHSADCLLRSVDFAQVEQLQRSARWEQAATLLAGEAQALQAAGAQLLVLCTNTMHKVADPIAAAIDIPLVHIADATAEQVRGAGLATVGLLATAYTMEQDFYVGRLRDRHGLRVLVPGPDDRRLVHRVITRSSARASSTTSPASSTGASCKASPSRVPRGSCWAAPRSTCWSAPTTRRSGCLTPLCCTASAR
jgi:aspartate racemase